MSSISAGDQRMSKRCFSCKTETGPLRTMTVTYDTTAWSLPVCDDCVRRMTGIEYLSIGEEGDAPTEHMGFSSDERTYGCTCGMVFPSLVAYTQHHGEQQR